MHNSINSMNSDSKKEQVNLYLKIIFQILKITGEIIYKDRVRKYLDINLIKSMQKAIFREKFL